MLSPKKTRGPRIPRAKALAGLACAGLFMAAADGRAADSSARPAAALDLPAPGIFDTFLALEQQGAVPAAGDITAPAPTVSSPEDAAAALGFRLADGLAALHRSDMETALKAWEDCRELAAIAGAPPSDIPPAPDFAAGASRPGLFALWCRSQNALLRATPHRPLVLAGMWVGGTRHVLSLLGGRSGLSTVLREPLYVGELERAVRGVEPGGDGGGADSLAQACAAALRKALPLVSQPPGVPLSPESLEILRGILDKAAPAAPAAPVP